MSYEHELKNRKQTRLKTFDYCASGVYFITICTLNRRCSLSQIVGTGVLDGPDVKLLPHGIIAEKYIKQLNDFYENIRVDRYVIMPNHVHLLLFVNHGSETSGSNGPSRTPVPTVQNSIVSRFISTFKRFCNKECGENIWQYRSYDHVIRNQKDYEEHVNYISKNPSRWFSDELYGEE